MAGLVCLGELLIDFVPTTQGQRLRDVPAFQKLAGGAPANVAVGFSRLGGQSRFVGKVGDDEFGHFLDETLQRAGVDTTYLIQDETALTTLAFVSLKSDGERDFMFYRRPGADTLLQPDEINGDAIRDANIYHFGSLSLLQEPSRSATLKLAEMAHGSQKLISYDPNLRPALWDDVKQARVAILEGLAIAHILKVSEEELEFLSDGGMNESAVTDLFSGYSKLQLIAVTKGHDGCRLYFRDGSVEVPGFQVEAVDTTGAGDAFTAALLFALDQRMQEHGSVSFNWSESGTFWRNGGEFANAVGAIVVTRRGGIPAMPTREEVEAFMEQHRP